MPRSDSFLDDIVLELAAQKLLENIGEALNQVRRTDPAMNAVIPNLHRYIGLRNHLSHGYDTVNYDVLWIIVIQEIPELARTLDEWLREAPDPDTGIPGA
ncbi:MAG: HepT-like ribonuclease domain-containing protein [Thermomicrobiales bacterium]